MGFFGIASTEDLDFLERRLIDRIREAREEIERNNRRTIEEEVRKQLDVLRSRLALSPIQLSGGATVTLEDIVKAVFAQIEARLEDRLSEKLKQAMDNLDLNSLADDFYERMDAEAFEEKLVGILVPLVRGDLKPEDITQAIADKFLEDEYVDTDDVTEAIAQAVANRMRYAPNKDS